ncbi:hypothetical protein P5P86_04670 [Nocardioides sp. BP30]|uniref:hypothetical protein n=1 Tax=Nocardioides sp. BP30 TaxID=3036374 RepID=UPI002468DCB0|nr:hypothetical protein [Nocardioides sp. BP30]WGL53117.1 hypothetical protein P5P86_04670 [Nocardioides sp. BP30]
MTEPSPPPSEPTTGFDLNRVQADLRSAGRIPLSLAAIGLLTLIWSFLPYYTVTFSSAAGFGGVSGSGSAWHGFFGWAGALLALAGGAVAILPALRVRVTVPPVTVLALFGVGFVCTLMALFIWPGDKVSMQGLDYGHGAGYWLALLFTLAGTAIAAYDVRQRA